MIDYDVKIEECICGLKYTMKVSAIDTKQAVIKAMLDSPKSFGVGHCLCTVYHKNDTEVLLSQHAKRIGEEVEFQDHGPRWEVIHANSGYHRHAREVWNS